MATVDIELFYDLDRRRWTTSAGGLATQPSMFIGQSNTIDFKVRFVQNGAPIELTNPSFIAGVKVTDDPLGDYLLLTTIGTKTGAGATTIYTFTLNIDSVELRAYLVGITPATNSTAFEVRDTVNNIATLPAITCSILPDYTLTGATPAAASGTLVVDSGATFTVHKTFAMPVDDGQNNYVLKTNGAGVGSWAVDSAGTGTVQSVSVTTANGVSGTVATSTTTPAITLTLGAITPTTGAFSDTTDATNSTTAPLKTAGGMAVAKSLYVGDGIQVLGNGNRSTITDELQIGGDLLVRNLTSYANEKILELLPVASSVNNVAIEPSVTGSPVHIYAQGQDANIGLHLQAKGTAFVNVHDSTDTTKRLRFSTSGNGTGITTTLASSSTTSQTITLPNATGATTLAGLQMTQSFTQVNTFSSATASTSIGTGAVVITGGLGVGGSAYVGGVINLPATTATAGQITQGGSRLFHTFGGAGNIWLGLTTGNTAGALVGGNNLGIGTSAGKSMTSGANNLLIGGNSGEFITSGFNNCCVGASSGYNIGAGTYNTAIGYVALQFGGSGGYNTAIGQASLQNITSGTLNTCIGSDAGDVDTIVVGGLTGKNITSGGNNTIIGAGAGSTLATGTYRTAIGSDSRCNNDKSIKLGRDHTASFVGDFVTFPTVLTANLPTATAAMAGSMLYVSDHFHSGSTGHMFFCNGSSWARIQ